MARTKKHVEVSVYGATGYGSSLVEAKQHAISRIEQAFSHRPSQSIFMAYTPTTWRFPLGHIGVLFRDLDGYAYGIMWPHQDGKLHTVSEHFHTEHEANVAMRRHIAQDYTSHEVSNHGRDILDSLDIDGHRNHERYIKFQEAYRMYAAQGMNETDCHRLACEAV